MSSRTSTTSPVALPCITCVASIPTLLTISGENPGGPCIGCDSSVISTRAGSITTTGTKTVTKHGASAISTITQTKLESTLAISSEGISTGTVPGARASEQPSTGAGSFTPEPSSAIVTPGQPGNTIQPYSSNDSGNGVSTPGVSASSTIPPPTSPVTELSTSLVTSSTSSPSKPQPTTATSSIYHTAGAVHTLGSHPLLGSIWGLLYALLVL